MITFFLSFGLNMLRSQADNFLDLYVIWLKLCDSVAYMEWGGESVRRRVTPPPSFFSPYLLPITTDVTASPRYFRVSVGIWVQTVINYIS